MEINTDQLRRNLQAYYASRVELLALVVVGIITLWLQSGMDLAEILLLQGIFGLFIMVLEFPSGVLADVTSRRKVLIIGMLGELLGLASYLVGNSFGYFVLAELFFAVALSFRSGSDTAMIFDSFTLLNLEEEGEDVLAKGKSYTFASMVVLQAIGGFLASISVQIVLWIAIIGVIGQMLLYVRSVEPIRQELKSSKETTRAAIGKLKQSSLVRVLLVTLLVAIFLRVSFWDYLPRFEKVGLPVWSFGLMLSGANLIAWSASIYVRKKQTLQSSINIYGFMGLLGVSLWLVADSVWMVLIAILLHQITRGGYGVASVISINKHAEANIRASVHSLISAIGSGLYFLFSITFELLKLGTEEILLSSTIGSTLLALTAFFVGLKTEQTDTLISTVIAD